MACGAYRLCGPLVLPKRAASLLGGKTSRPERLLAARYCTSAPSHTVTDAPPRVPVVPPPPPLIAALTEPVPLSAPAPRQLDEPLPSKLTEVWVENMDAMEERKLGLLELHPEVFAAYPRIHLIFDNIRWQRLYAKVDHAVSKTRAEKRGGGRKPTPQKGLGQARRGSTRSPIFKNGGVAHGPRGPTSHFFMLPFSARVGGLCATLSVKLAQGDLRVVSDLQLPSSEPGFLQQLADERLWGPSVLFVDDTDEMPESIAAATSTLPHINLLPVYGLNVHCMLKHSTLVMTVAGVERIQERLLHALSRPDCRVPRHTEASLLK